MAEEQNKIQTLEEPVGDYGIEYTYADYLKFEFEEMVEIIRGRIFRMSPAPISSHQKISVNLSGLIWSFLRGKKCQIFSAPFDVILPVANKKRETATTVVQPDICVICNPDMIEEAGCFGAPDWIIEILSPHTRKKDFQLKYDVYEEAGVAEYWIVMPLEKLIEVFVLENGKYKRIKTYAQDDEVTSHTLPDLTLNLEEVFE
ncbi:MAG: Uma2 family endonuclease [Saprospiraceae bacterium]|nr:Uma2 family endonuclease [Saprospiraceae bacterium]